MNAYPGVRLAGLACHLFAILSLPLLVYGGPTISPTSITLPDGDSFKLAVTDDSSSTNPVVVYEWKKGGQALQDDGRITGSQTPELTVTDAVVSDSGKYVAALTLADGTQTNLSATVAVVLVTVPQIQKIDFLTVGDDVSFKVTASGGMLSYQWFWQEQAMLGATNSTLVLSNAYVTANAGYYRVAVSNIRGTTFSPEPGTLFTKPTPSGTYQGIFYNGDAISSESSGFIQFSVTAKNRKFTGKIQSGLNTWKFWSTFGASHEAQVEVARPGLPSLLLDLQVLTTGDIPAIQGTVSDGNWTSSLRAVQLPYSSKSPAPQAGKYTLALHSANMVTTAPAGDCWATIQVVNSGTLSMSGQAADGSAIKQSCGISKLGEWPLYVPMYQGQGMILGWLRFTNQSSGNLRGSTVYWVKPPQPDVYYPGGFSRALTPIGSSYVQPATATNAILNFPVGVAGFSGGDLFEQDTGIWSFVKVTLKRPAGFDAEKGVEKLKLSAVKSTGVLSGSFVDQATGLACPIRGVVLQQQNLAAGYFLSTNTAGAFQLVPK